MKGWQAKVYRKAGEAIRRKSRVIEEAVEGVRSGLYKNSREAANALGISQSFMAVWHRLKKAKAPIEAHEKQQTLTAQQEHVTSVTRAINGIGRHAGMM